MGNMKNARKSGIGEDAEQLEPAYTDSKSINLHTHFGI